jgi:hypothetical protein
MWKVLVKYQELMLQSNLDIWCQLMTLSNMLTQELHSQVASHFNLGLVNPGLFNPKLFNHEFFNNSGDCKT